MEFLHLIEQLAHDIDPITISTELRKNQIITKSQCDHVLRLFNDNQSRQDIWKQLLNFIGQTFNISVVSKILENSGYNSIALTLLVQYVLSKRSQRGIQRLGNQSSNRQFSQRLFVNLKIETHNNSFHNPRKFLRSLSQRFKIKFETENDELLKAHKADKYAAVLCAEIDSHTMLYKKEFPGHGLFDELKRIIPSTSDFHTTNVAYNARMGIAYAITEDFEKADDFLKDARVSSHNIEQCVEMHNMLYIHVFNLLCEYEKNPTVDTKRRVLEIADMGLKCLENEEDTIRTFWKRMFFLRIVYCNLGLSNKGDPILVSLVTEECQKRAKKLLGEIDRYWNGMEARRKMFYYAARARINELEENFDSAIAYLKNATKIGTDGNFGELPYLIAYAEKIKENQRLCTEATMSFDSSPMGMTVMNHKQQYNEETFVKGF